MVNATLFREPMFANPDRLVEIYQNTREGGQGVNTYPAYLDMAEYTSVFAQITAASVPNGATYLDRGVVRSGVVEYTTATYLAVLGLQPSLGRWYDAAEDRPGTDIVAVIGHQAWTTRFGGDPSVIGRTIHMQGYRSPSSASDRRATTRRSTSASSPISGCRFRRCRRWVDPRGLWNGVPSRPVSS